MYKDPAMPSVGVDARFRSAQFLLLVLCGTLHGPTRTSKGKKIIGPLQS
jgi:hypothetical protein